jgi:hypothetical protein
MYINHVKSSCLSINGPCSSMFLNFVNRFLLISFQNPGLASRPFIRETNGRGHWQLQGFNATADPLTPGFDVRGPAWFLAFFQCASKKHILFRSEKWKTGWGLKFYFESWSWLKFIKSPGAMGVNPSKRESIRIISPCRMETEKISFRQPETNDRCIVGHAFFLWHGLTIVQLSDCWKMLPKKTQVKIGSTECSISPLVITILHKTAGFPVWLISTIPAPSHWYQWFAYIISAKIYHSATFIRGDLGLSSKKLWALTLPRNSSCPSCWSHKMCVTWSPFTMWLPYGNTKQNDQRAWCGSNLSCQ